MTMSQVVGSTVRSITSVSGIPPSVEPDEQQPTAGLSLAAWIAHRHVLVVQKLLGLLGGDAAASKLVERDVCDEQLQDRLMNHGTVYRPVPTECPIGCSLPADRPDRSSRSA